MTLDCDEFEDLMDEIQHRFSRANVDGSLMDLLKKLGWESLMPGEAEPLFTYAEGKILVIGEETVGIDTLRMTINKLRPKLKRFEFALGYEEAQTFNYGKLAYNPGYRVVLIGAVPHSTTGTGQSGSLVAELQNHPDKYPRVIPLRTEDGTLKITKSNFRNSLKQLLSESYIAA